MRTFRRSFLALAVSVFTWLSVAVQAQSPAAPASMVAGVIKASNVRGDVRRVNLSNQSEVPLRNGDNLAQDNAIFTGSGASSVVLVFANGSTVRVGNESRIEIKEFLMDPLEADIASVAALTREPTKSRTNLRLEYGEVVGNVKTLNHAEGSTFSVSTPAGAAGIRGTTFRIVYRPTGNGQAFNFQLSTSEGVVVFEGITATGRGEVQVPIGREVSFIARINPADNSLVFSFPGGGPGLTGGPGGAPGGGPRGLPPSIPISPEAVAALQDATVQLIQVQQQTRFTRIEVQRTPGAPGGATPPGTPGTPGTPAQPGQPSQPGAANSAAPTLAPNGPAGAQRPPSPPTPAAFPPRTTPGDGR